jgi:hypothetical protein
MMIRMKKKIPDQVLKTFWRIPQLMSPEDIFSNSLDFSHLINVTMTARFFCGETVGYFVVHLVRSHGFQSAQKVDVKLKVLIPVNIC